MANCLTVSSAGVTRGNGFGLEKIKHTFLCFSLETFFEICKISGKLSKGRAKDVEFGTVKWI